MGNGGRLELRQLLASSSLLQTASGVPALAWGQAASSRFSCCFSNCSLDALASSREGSQGSSLAKPSIVPPWEVSSSKTVCFEAVSSIPCTAGKSHRSPWPARTTLLSGVLGVSCQVLCPSSVRSTVTILKSALSWGMTSSDAAPSPSTSMIISWGRTKFSTRACGDSRDSSWSCCSMTPPDVASSEPPL